MSNFWGSLQRSTLSSGTRCLGRGRPARSWEFCVVPEQDLLEQRIHRAGCDSGPHVRTRYVESRRLRLATYHQHARVPAPESGPTG